MRRIVSAYCPMKPQSIWAGNLSIILGQRNLWSLVFQNSIAMCCSIWVCFALRTSRTSLQICKAPLIELCLNSPVLSRWISKTFKSNILISDRYYLNNIPLCVCVCVCIYMYVYDIFFIHSSVDKHLGYFHVLAIKNITVIKKE